MREKKARLHQMEYVQQKKRLKLKQTNNLDFYITSNKKTKNERIKENQKNFKLDCGDEYVQKILKLKKIKFDNNNNKFFENNCKYLLDKIIYPVMFMTHFKEKDSNYCVLNIKEYKNRHKLNKYLKFIDPAVIDLKKNDDYPHKQKIIDLIENNLLEQNEYITLDYPCDYKEGWQDEFIRRSVENNFRWADNEKYICTIQSKLFDINDFYYRFKELEPVFANKTKILGIGAACSHTIKPNKFTDECFYFLRRNAHKIYWIHFYGVGTALIKKYFPALQNCGIRISFDSTKYRFTNDPYFKRKYGVIADYENIQTLYFYSYINQLKKYVNHLIW